MNSIKKIETVQAPKALGPYSQGVIASPFIFVSGQLPIDLSTQQIVKGAIIEQVNCVLDHIEAILQASQCTLENVVRCDVFLKNLDDFPQLNQEYAKRFTSHTPPARQTVQVARLPLDALVEISCIAIAS